MIPPAATSASQPSRRESSSRRIDAGLRVSGYDRLASLLISLLLLLGLAVVCLLTIWMSFRLFPRPKSVPVQLAEVGGNRGGVAGDSRELNSPDPVPLDAQAATAEDLPSALAAVAEAVAKRRAQLDDSLVVEQFESSAGGQSKGAGQHVGLGAGGGSGSGYPRPQRWEVRFPEGGTLQTYAQQLAYFRIELGVLGLGEQVLYANNVDAAKRVGRRADEQRLYMSWRGGGLKGADQQLLRQSGIDPGEKIVLHFFSPEAEQQLARLEQEHLKRHGGGRDLSRVVKTRFGVRAAGDGYEFFVQDQTYF